ncbi:MAG TPA: hypothetical protein VGT61_08135 [Thermomicrobiales bacterium]|jgi:hypothetical protein|nr:hypothetical protein [Thermomicrobiales bacterium]
MVDASVERDSARAEIALGGIRASIPAAVIGAMLAGSAARSEPVSVDARDLAITIPPAAIAELIRAARPDLDLTVTFEDSALLVSLGSMPPVRVVVPDDGLRLLIGPDGIRLRG